MPEPADQLPLALVPWDYGYPPDHQFKIDECWPFVPAYRPVEAPPCRHTILTPKSEQESMPARVECDLPAGHDGNHLKVWDRAEGTAMGWPASIPDARTSTAQADRYRELGVEI